MRDYSCALKLRESTECAKIWNISCTRTFHVLQYAMMIGSSGIKLIYCNINLLNAVKVILVIPGVLKYETLGVSFLTLFHTKLPLKWYFGGDFFRNHEISYKSWYQMMNEMILPNFCTYKYYKASCFCTTSVSLQNMN